MRTRILGASEHWLDQAYEAPPGVRTMLAWRLEREPAKDRVSIKLHEGAGIWNAQGALLFFDPRLADLCWLTSSTRILAAENAFARAAEGASIDHRLKLLGVERFEAVTEALVTVPHGELNFVVRSVAGDVAAVTWLDQNAWGYVVVDTSSLAPTGLTFTWPSSTIAPPAFSPNGTLIAACNFLRTSWWNDEEDDPAHVPSPGGLWQLATLSAQSVTTSAVSTCKVFAELPEGWLPDRPYEGKWSNLSGPEFTSDDELRVWLPDGSERRISLPLPPRIVVTGLRPTRNWLSDS